MDTVEKISHLQKVLLDWRKEGMTIGLVPTMGAIHDGHLSLVQEAKARCDRVVATSFINPKQFAPGEDLNSYPRDEVLDKIKFTEAGASLLFYPNVKEIYPVGHITEVNVKGLSEILEGESRPNFFKGVATIISKLLILISPNIAVFGEKDYQQLCVIRTLVQDLNFLAEILAMPTIREPDGLAMSSRNTYLSSEERKIAPFLYQSLCEVSNRVFESDDIELVCSSARQKLLNCGFNKVDYFVVSNSPTLKKYFFPSSEIRVLAAVWLGKTRLIDNVQVTFPNKNH